MLLSHSEEVCVCVNLITLGTDALLCRGAARSPIRSDELSVPSYWDRRSWRERSGGRTLGYLIF